MEPQLCVLRLHFGASALRLSRSPPDLRTMHLYLLMLRFEDAFQAVNASLKCFHGLEGCISPWKSIPQRTFHRIGMHPSRENNPWRRIPPNRDAFVSGKASLSGLFIEQGCFRLGKIIPGDEFFRIGMYSPLEKHPSADFSSNRDASTARKASLSGLFTK